MFCSGCGKEIPEGTTKCPECGKDNAKVNDFASSVQAGVDAFKRNQEDRKVNSLSDVIIDPQEQQIAVMGSGYLDSMLHGGGLKKGFVISDNSDTYCSWCNYIFYSLSYDKAYHVRSAFRRWSNLCRCI